MQNTSLGSKIGSSKSLHNVAESAKETTEQLTSDLSGKANRLATDTTETAREYYNKASSWMQENYGKTLGAVGILAVGGIVGYFIGRSNSRSEFQTLMPRG